MRDTPEIYDDGAAYGPDPEAELDEPTPDPLYDDGATYGQ